MAYLHGWFTAEAAYLGPNGNLNSATDFATADTDKRFQWRVLDSIGKRQTPASMSDMPAPSSMGAKPMLDSEGYKPLEVGLYGGNGVFQTSDGLLDRYHAAAIMPKWIHWPVAPACSSSISAAMTVTQAPDLPPR